MMLQLRRLFCAVLLMGLAIPAEAASQFYEPQPPGKLSTMFGLDWEPITDLEFASMAGSLLLNNGNSNARGATFLFEQCFSGGMFDDLDDVFGDELRWVGGSAARHDELSYGQGNSASYPMDHWVRSLTQVMGLVGLPMINLVNLARAGDAAGPYGSGSENPQTLFRNGGDTINHRQGGASGHNAILWAGNANAQRHVNDIKVMYELLKSAYMNSGDPWSIIVLGDSDDLGFDALPATKANLQHAFEIMGSLQNANADFLFFASDHGGSDTLVLDKPLAIGPASSWLSSFELRPTEVQGMLETEGATPGVVLRFDGLTGPGVSVYLDDVELGDAFLKRDRFGDSLMCVDAEILRLVGLDPEIRVLNRTAAEVTLVEAFFRTSGVDNIVQDFPAVLVGDANSDCVVGAADYAIWAAEFGQRGGLLSADFDGNGTVGTADYALWAANFGKTCPGGVPVPEPATALLALAGVVALVGVGSCRRSRTARLERP